MAFEECVAANKLEKWLEEHGKSQAWLAAKCGVKPPSVHAWLNRTSRPLPYLREVIEVLTGGDVLEPDWEFQSEKSKRDDAIRQIRAEAEEELLGDAAYTQLAR